MSSVVYHSFSTFVLITAIFTVGCSAQPAGDASLESLRLSMKDGKLPPESVASDVERRYAGKQTGTLAKLLRARIRLENKDFAGAAALLNSDEFEKRTKLGDYALWLRGQALQQAGNHAEAMTAAAKLIAEYPDSLHVTDTKLLWASSAISSGQAANVSGFLSELLSINNAGALLVAAKAFEAAGNQTKAIELFRKTYFYGAGTDEAKEAEAKLTALAQPLTPLTAEEIRTRAEKLYSAKNYVEAEKSFATLATSFPAAATSDVHLKRLITFSNLKRLPDAQGAFAAIPASAKEKEEAFYQLATGYAKAKLWPDARRIAEEMRRQFPQGKLTVKTWVDAGYAARDTKNKGEEQYFLGAALANYPNAVEVAGAQFELAWLEHEAKNFAKSSQMFTEHLARYAEKDTTNRGKAGYWSARDSEKAGKTAEACALYEGVVHRYAANWYGYLSLSRITSLKGQGKCTSPQNFTAGSLVPKAVANLKTVTVAAETSTLKELERAEKSEQLSTIGLFDWAIDELEEAKKTAANSPKINLSLAKHFRFKGDNVGAFSALRASYPDYSQMFPEEMGREEWEIFYPLAHWEQIREWAKNRNLDLYQVAGLIRQESVFDPRAKSHANAYGLMQLLLPTARSVARKYGSTVDLSSAESLYLPAANIELGTAYMRDQFDKFGRIEYVAVAYNAGPGRVPQWRASLPLEIDEFVEAIPFKETKGYVQGVIRNSAQYRRLYDENGSFKPNVGSRPIRAEIDSKPGEQFSAEFPEIILDNNSE
ncbi:MAG: transglycosylase SLT domain-containing protein [Blastocatellia bacterium]